MTVLVAVAVVLVAVAATSVVLTQDPKRQAIALSVLGVTLTLVFLALQAPDVALSELVVNALIVPLIIVLATEKVRNHR